MGYVPDRLLHGQLGIRFDVPAGFQIDNSRGGASHRPGRGRHSFRRHRRHEPAQPPRLTSPAAGVTGLKPIRSARSRQRLEAATARASADRWDFGRHGDQGSGERIYRFLTAVPKARAHSSRRQTSCEPPSAALTSGEVQSLKPLRIRVVTVRSRADTICDPWRPA